MIRIGLIGTQSMHAWAFAQVCNVPDENGNMRLPQARVTAVYGVDDTQEHIEETLKRGNIPHQSLTLEDLCQSCDAVMILQRKGTDHIRYACELIRRGFPVFIDKPVCNSLLDIELLAKTIANHKAVVCGGSGLKYNKQLVALKKEIEQGSFGTVKGGTIVYSADINSPYDGIFFYLPHAVEMMLELYGYDPISVRTTVLSHNNFTVCVKYDKALVNLALNGSKEAIVVVNGDRSEAVKINDKDIFEENMRKFVASIENREFSEDVLKLTQHVRVVLAVMESIERDTEVRIL